MTSPPNAGRAIQRVQQAPPPRDSKESPSPAGPPPPNAGTAYNRFQQQQQQLNKVAETAKVKAAAKKETDKEKTATIGRGKNRMPAPPQRMRKVETATVTASSAVRSVRNPPHLLQNGRRQETPEVKFGGMTPSEVWKELERTKKERDELKRAFAWGTPKFPSAKFP